MSRIIFLVVFLLVIGLLELYIFKSLKALFPTGKARKISRILYFGALAVNVTSILMVFILFGNGISIMGFWSNLFIGLAFTLFITKLVIAPFLLIEDVFRVGKWSFYKARKVARPETASVPMDSRRKFIGRAGIVLASLPFTSLLYGILKGKYDFRVEKIPLQFAALPTAFNNLKIVQISDIHSGSFDSMDGVKKGVEMIQAQNPDLILFTGDLVNNLSEEIEPYIELFKNLHAPLGKFSVMGNHDYGSYVKWKTSRDKVNNIKRLKANHARMGFQLLDNDSVLLERQGQAIRLAGVENWGRKPFPQHGDLDQAFAKANEQEFTILMSHDPTHWDMKVLDHPRHVHLTLSGHTHGGQMGVEIPGVKWSPAAMVYERWAGLYQQKGQYLYVNRGFGFIGYPGRAGIWPEITLLELTSEG